MPSEVAGRGDVAVCGAGADGCVVHEPFDCERVAVGVGNRDAKVGGVARLDDYRAVCWNEGIEHRTVVRGGDTCNGVADVGIAAVVGNAQPNESRALPVVCERRCGRRAVVEVTVAVQVPFVGRKRRGTRGAGAVEGNGSAFGTRIGATRVHVGCLVGDERVRLQADDERVHIRDERGEVGTECRVVRLRVREKGEQIGLVEREIAGDEVGKLGVDLRLRQAHV